VNVGDDGSVDIGPVSEYPPGTIRVLAFGDREVGVYNVRGEFFAIRNFCPHRGAPICRGQLTGTMVPSGPGKLEWGLEGQVVQCPWHRWEFDLRTGKALFGVDRRRLILYEVGPEGDRLVLRLRPGDVKRLRGRGARRPTTGGAR
jgi:3-phenylpropionate/trans-cinnamate dioxygenase ferredoxin subunit